MNSNIFLKILIIILIFFIFLIVLSATLSDLHSWITFEPDNVQITEGKVVRSYYDYGISSRTRSSRRYKKKVLIVEYNVNDKTYTTQHKISYGIADDSQVGDTRKVSYNEYKPQYGYVRPTISVHILYYTILIIGTIFLCLFVFIIGKLLFYYRIVKKHNYL